MKDGPPDPFTVRVVPWIRSHRFDADGSIRHGGYDHSPSVVLIRTEPKIAWAETLRLVKLFEKAGIVLSPMFNDGSKPETFGPSVAAFFDPTNDYATIEILGLTDANLPKELP